LTRREYVAILPFALRKQRTQANFQETNKVKKYRKIGKIFGNGNQPDLKLPLDNLREIG